MKVVYDECCRVCYEENIPTVLVLETGIGCVDVHICMGCAEKIFNLLMSENLPHKPNTNPL